MTEPAGARSSRPARPKGRRRPARDRVVEHRLLCGDATSPSDLARAMGGKAADILWTDPPYGVNYEGKTRQRLRVQGDRPKGLRSLLDAAFAAASAVLRPGAA